MEQLYKNLNHRKTLRNTQNSYNLLKSKECKYQNTSYVGARFLHLAWQGGRGGLSVMPLIRCISNMNSHKFFDRITRQDAGSVLWVYRHNSWHAAWPTVILRFMETRWRTLALWLGKLN